MTLSIVKSKRKVSCLPCRYRKVKCDGGQQPCQRCIKRKTPDQCTYLTPGQVGRRPKNAVINKLVLNRNKQPNSGNQYKEFIFENVCYAMPVDAIFINDDSTKNLYYFINTLFNYEEPIMQIAVSRVNKAIPYIPDVLMYDLLEIYTVGTVELLNVVVNKLSALSLDNFFYYDAISASVIQDLAFKYFSEPPPTLPTINPLSTLSPYQAIHMIDTFFTVNPHSIFLNKTLVTQGYWTDALDPLLLCVIYGTATYMAKMLNGQPLRLWEAADEMTRNPFLEYAYILVQKSSSEVSLAKYQAVVLLGLFEVVFGFPKRGLVNLGLAFMIGINLGISDGSFQEKSNDIQAELANLTFWSTFNGTCRGVVDMGQMPHYSKNSLSLKLPPPNVEQSVSYQFEKSSGDLRRYQSFDYLMETFYVHCVCCKFISKLLLELPEVRHNMFYPRLKRSAAGLRRVGYPKPDDLGARLQKVIQEFGAFIQETKHTLSTSQVYTLETVQALQDLHFGFLKNAGPVMDGVNYGNTAYDFLQDIRLLPDDPTTIARVQVALPKVYRVMDRTHDFLSDPTNYNNKPSLLPRGLIVSVLESTMEILFIQLTSDPWDESSFDYLKLVEKITQQQDIWTDWSAIGTVQARIKKYFDEGIGGSTAMAMGETFLDISDQTSPSDSFSPALTNPSTADDDLAYAAFFDPCGTWLNPMRNSMVNLRLLPGVPESVPTISTPGSNTTLRTHLSDYNHDYYNNIVQPSPPSLDYNTDLMTTAFVTELENLDDNQVPVQSSSLNNNNSQTPSSNYLPSAQCNLSNDLAKCHLDQANELFIPTYYPTPSDDQPFV